MKLLFDKNRNGAEELRELTGSYYESNDFTRIKTDVILQTESLIDLVGEAVYNRATAHYTSDNYLKDIPTETDLLNDHLVQHLQLPIALMASLRYYQTNLVSHEDAGRKVKIDEGNEKMAWEWMLDRDDEAHIRKAFSTIDRLIRFLDKNNPDEWKNSDQKKAAKALFINNTEAFNDIYPIDNSPRFYHSTLPFNKEVQRLVIKKALGDMRYDQLLEYFQNPESVKDESLDRLLELVKLAIPIHVMVLALKRFPVQVLPEGVVQQFKSATQSRNASASATAEIIRVFALNLENDAKQALDAIKKELNNQDPDANKYQYLPKNKATNTYFRT